MPLPGEGFASSFVVPPGPVSLGWFGQMVPRCKAYAEDARRAGRPVVGLMCEYAPRELVLAAGGVPVLLCGGDADTIPAAEGHLPANLCPLIKSTYGFLVERSNPFLEMADLVVAETTCDGKKKMFELMGEQRSTYLLELPQKENDPDALDHWHRELERFKGFLEARYRVAITAEKLRAAVQLMNRERALRRGVAELTKTDAPPLTGRQVLEFKSVISGIPEALAQCEETLDSLRRGQRDDAQFRIRNPQSPIGNGPIRVLLTGVPMVHGAERVIDLIEERGALVVCQENCTGLKPILEDVPDDAPDLLRALAAKYLHMPCPVKSPNTRRLELLRQLAREYRAECVIELIWHACHIYAVESFRVKRLVEDELGLPYLRVETDYSPFDSARIGVRVEALVEMVQMRRGAASSVQPAGGAMFAGGGSQANGT